MELLLLWRWSTLVQVSSDLLIAVFFVVLARSMTRLELRIWARAWLANLAALSVTILFWALQPQTRMTFVVLAPVYLFAKTMFLLLLVDGALGFVAPNRPRFIDAKRVGMIALACALCGVVVQAVDLLGLVGSTAISVCMAAGAVLLARSPASGTGWLATGFALRAVLGAGEAVAFAINWAAGGKAGSGILAAFVASHSSFDTGSEWVIALGCVLTLYGSIHRQLTQSNHELLSAKEELQTLLDHDQLTGVLSRRAMPTLLREAQATGASILFFDLDAFKRINDVRGHHIGDACLARFAHALSDNFSGDRVIRYAGDEFIVLTRDREPSQIAEIIGKLRADLADPVDGQRISFSVGSANLCAQGDAEATLRAADQAMYDDKARRSA